MSASEASSTDASVAARSTVATRASAASPVATNPTTRSRRPSLQHVSTNATVAPLLRAALVVTAAVMLAVHLPELFRGGGHDMAEHVARHAAVCPVAFAIALGAVALRPSRARGLLPVTAALAAALLLTGAIDISRRITPIMAETDHLTEIIGAVLVWLTARSVSHPTPARDLPVTSTLPPAPDGQRRPFLHLVSAS